MDSVNIVIMGKTGSGKSTLLNSVLMENVAPTGNGQRITTENKLYSRDMLLPLASSTSSDSCYRAARRRLNLYDTVGLEIDKGITKKTLEDIKRFLQKARENKNDITMVWFCVNDRCSRFENYEIRLIRELSMEYEIPFVIVLTQCFSNEKGELEKQIEEDLSEVARVRVLAEEYRLATGIVIHAFGIQELLVSSISDYSHNKVKLLERKLESLSLDLLTEIDQSFDNGVREDGRMVARIREEIKNYL